MLVQGDPHVPRWQDEGGPDVLDDDLRPQDPQPHIRQHPPQQGRILRPWEGDRTRQQGLRQGPGHRDPVLVGHAPELGLALQTDAAVGAVVDPQPVLGPGVGAVLVFQQAAVREVVEVDASDGVAPLRSRMGIRLQQTFQPRLLHPELAVVAEIFIFVFIE